MKNENSNHILKRMWKYLKIERKRLIIIVLLTIFSTILSIIAPLLISNVIDNYIIKKTLDGLPLVLIILAIIYLTKSLFSWITSVQMTTVSENTLYILRKDLFDKLESISISFFDKNEKGDIMSRFTNDITIISDALTEVIVDVINSVIMLIGVTFIMFYVNSILAVTTIMTVPLLFLIAFRIGKKASIYFDLNQKFIGEISSISEEYASNMKTIKSFCNEKEVLEEFNKKSDKLKDNSVKAQLYGSLLLPANTFVTNIGNILIILIGSILVLKEMTTVGSIIAFLTYASMFRQPITSLASLFSTIASALAGAKRVFQILDTEIEVKNKINCKNLDIEGNIQFNNVHFSYNEKKTIDNLNFSVGKGETIAIVGPTGAGKTTIINLLVRFYDVDAGSITINNINIAEVNQEDLRKNIGIVLQDTYLFKGTVKENIKYGNINATDEEVIDASKKAMAHNFIHRLTNGYNSLVDEEGTNFSQGERQLISIARAILSNPKILILDEATSNIDTSTELLIQKGMKELMKGKTSFIIAHRLSTIRDATKIIVLENGKITEQGTHNQLIEQSGLYKKMYNNQFK